VAYIKALWKHWWALMSSAIFTAIGVYGAWQQKGNSWIVGVSFAAAIALFFVASFREWNEEHKARGVAESALNDQVPKPSLEYSAQHALQHMTYSGLLVPNCGKNSAFKITLVCDPVGKLRLRFDDMPIQRIDPGENHPIRVHMEQLGDNGIWCSQGGTPGMQIEMCFDRMDTGDERQEIPVTIKYFDYDGKQEHASRWFILRDGAMFADKRIWCEMAQAAGSAS
jgi:hypothetical protein